MKCKKFLNEVLQLMLEPIRVRRREFENDIPAVLDVLRQGTERARETASQTMSEVRRAMRIDYFNDSEMVSRFISGK